MNKKENDSIQRAADYPYTEAEAGVSSYIDDPAGHAKLLAEHQNIFEQSIRNIGESLKLLAGYGNGSIIEHAGSEIRIADAIQMLEKMLDLYHSSLKLLKIVMDNSMPQDSSVILNERHAAVIEAIKESKYATETEAWESILVQLTHMLPLGVAKVYLPAEFPIVVPAVGAWQRQMGMTADGANREYIALLADTRQTILADIKIAREPDESEFDIDDEIENKIYIRSFLDVMKIDNLLFDYSHMLQGGKQLKYTKLSAFGNMNYTQSIPESAELARQLRYTKKVLSRFEQYETRYGDEVANESIRKARKLLGEEWQSAVYDTFYTILEKRMQELVDALNGYRPGAVQSYDVQVPLRQASKIEAQIKSSDKNVEDMPINERGEYHQLLAPWSGEEMTVKIVEVEGHRIGLSESVSRQNQPFTDSITGPRELAAIASCRDIAMHRAVNNGDWQRLPIIAYTDRAKYPSAIRKLGKMGRSGIRVYHTLITADQCPEIDAMGVDKVLVYLGACTKETQDSFLVEFTGMSAKQHRVLGAGN